MWDFRKYGKWILTVVALLWCVVIWQFSLAPASASSATSGTVRKFLNETLATAGISFRFTHTMVRKIAHFTEFFILGILTHATFRAHRAPYPPLLAVAAALVVATVDECIQIFVPGRGPGVLDVLLDTAGGIVGMLTLLGVLALALYIKIKRTKNVKKISKTP